MDGVTTLGPNQVEGVTRLSANQVEGVTRQPIKADTGLGEASGTSTSWAEQVFCFLLLVLNAVLPPYTRPTVLACPPYTWPSCHPTLGLVVLACSPYTWPSCSRLSTLHLA